VGPLALNTRRLVRCAVIALVALTACRRSGVSDDRPKGPAWSKDFFDAGTTPTEYLIGAGDIARCELGHDEETAKLLEELPGTVYTLGDNAYSRGTVSEFAKCYEPSWGKVKARTRPSAGNHDYYTAGAAGYYGYFGAAAGDPSKGYYSYDLGSWHIVVLNSNCDAVSCNEGDAQEKWLREDLAAHPAKCTLAYWHHPRFTSGPHGDNTLVAPLVRALYEANADVVLAGHDHHYERLAPLDPDGALDLARGIRHFVVGTGGTSLRSVSEPRPHSEVHNDDTHGVLAFALREDGYSWQFIAAGDGTLNDSGSAKCH
jgi:hypothetical protein